MSIKEIGICKLALSAKGTLSMLVLAAAEVANLTGHLDGMSFAAVIGTISTIFMWSHSRTNLAAIQASVELHKEVK